MPVPRMKPMYDEYVRSPSVALAARSVATVSLTTAICPPPMRLSSSRPTYWPTIAGALMPLVQQLRRASRSGVTSALYEKHQPNFFAVAFGATRLSSSANGA